MNVLVAANTPKLDAFVGELFPPEAKQNLMAGLPKHMRPEVFERNAVNLIMDSPELMQYPANLLFREIAKAAALGLYLDKTLGEAYIVPAYNYKTKRTEPQLRVGYRGLIKLARQSGKVSSVYCVEVRKNDPFSFKQGTEREIVHTPDPFKSEEERGEIVGYYAVIKYTYDDFDYEAMSVSEVHAIRDRSDAYKAFKDGKIKSTPWATDEGEMSKKTVFRRLMKRQDLSSEMAQAIEIEDTAEFPSFRAPRLVPPPINAIAAPQEEVEETSAATLDPDMPPVGDPAPTPEEAPVMPPPITKKAEPKKEAKKEQADPNAIPSADNATAFLAWLGPRLQKIESGEALESFWNDEIAPRIDGWMGPDYEDAMGLYRKNEARFN
jgi:recombination protein RecT